MHAPATQNRDWPSIRAYAKEHGLRAAAKHFGVPFGTVAARSHREQWSANPSLFSPVPAPAHTGSADDPHTHTANVSQTEETGLSPAPRKRAPALRDVKSELQRHVLRAMDAIGKIKIDGQNVHRVAGALERIERAARVPFGITAPASGPGALPIGRRINAKAHNARGWALPAPIDIEAQVTPAIETEETDDLDAATE